MVARPAIAPDAAPRVVGLPLCFHSTKTHIAMPDIPAICVAIKAEPAISLAARRAAAV